MRRGGTTALCAAMLIGIVACSSEAPERSPRRIPVVYGVRVNGGDPTSVRIRFTSASGEEITRTLEGIEWESSDLSFHEGDRLRLSAVSRGDPDALIQCTITTVTAEDPDGTVHGSGGGARCSASARAGTNPFEGID
jgi:hypothetical protein